MATIPSDNTLANFLASAKGLRLWWGHQKGALRKLLELAPHWGIPPHVPWDQLRIRLEVLHSNLMDLQLQERLERAKVESEDGDDEGARRHAASKSSMLAKLCAEWRKKRCSAPCVTLVADGELNAGELLSEPDVAGEIARHWSGVFAHPRDVEEAAFAQLGTKMQQLEWPNVSYSIEECAEVLDKLAKKKCAPGPDGLMYSAWKHG
eukprot:5282564-Amphidinium_carterae.2